MLDRGEIWRGSVESPHRWPLDQSTAPQQKILDSSSAPCFARDMIQRTFIAYAGKRIPTAVADGGLLLGLVGLLITPLHRCGIGR
jgi:hypothetical protein